MLSWKAAQNIKFKYRHSGESPLLSGIISSKQHPLPGSDFGPGFDTSSVERGIGIGTLEQRGAHLREQGPQAAGEVHGLAVYVFDKGYCDYNWWHRIDRHKALFVTRFKRNASLRVERSRAIPAEDAEVVLHDEIVRFANKHPRGGRRNHYDRPLRRVTVARPEHDAPLVLATNDLDSPAGVPATRAVQFSQT